MVRAWLCQLIANPLHVQLNEMHIAFWSIAITTETVANVCVTHILQNKIKQIKRKKENLKHTEQEETNTNFNWLLGELVWHWHWHVLY